MGSDKYFWSFLVAALCTAVLCRKIPIKSEYFFPTFDVSGTEKLDFKSNKPLIPLDCATKCLNFDTCKGWKTVDGECTMLTEAVTDEPTLEQYIRSDGCDNVQCQNSGTCETQLPTIVTKRGFRCNCKCGTCGPLCEKMNFVKIPNKGISQNNIAEKKVETEIDCMKECLADAECQSVDFSTKEKICFINSANHFAPGVGLLPYRHVHYFYPNCSGSC